MYPASGASRSTSAWCQSHRRWSRRHALIASRRSKRTRCERDRDRARHGVQLARPASAGAPHRHPRNGLAVRRMPESRAESPGIRSGSAPRNPSPRPARPLSICKRRADGSRRKCPAGTLGASSPPAGPSRGSATAPKPLAPSDRTPGPRVRVCVSGHLRDALGGRHRQSRGLNSGCTVAGAKTAARRREPVLFGFKRKNERLLPRAFPVPWRRARLGVLRLFPITARGHHRERC